MVARDFFGWPFRAGVVVGAVLASVGAGALWLGVAADPLDEAFTSRCAQAEATPQTVAPRAPVPAIMAIYRFGAVRMDGEELSSEEFIARLAAKVKLAELGGIYSRPQYRSDRKLFFNYVSLEKPVGSHPYHLR